MEVRDTRGRLITVIEVLSPTNKSGDGRRAYRRRQRAYLALGVNLVEIDLLRKGSPVVSLPSSELSYRAQAPYMVCIFRSTRPEARELDPLPLRERLPGIRVPLRASDTDVVLELQPLIDQGHESGGYWTLDYRRDPEPPLSAEDAKWLDELLRSQGLR